MYWNQALKDGILSPMMSCNLFIVGSTADGQPICHDDCFELVDANESTMTLSLEYEETHSLNRLQKVDFIEFSFRDSGILYYAFVDLLHKETKRGRFALTFQVPAYLNEHQNRRHPRILLSERLTAVCRIVGVRRKSTHEGQEFSVQIMELSANGLSFLSPIRLVPPLYLRFSFQLPMSSYPLELYAEIVRLNPFGEDSYRIAAEFREVPEQAFDIMSKFCADHDER